jgi:hypothetical protein
MSKPYSLGLRRHMVLRMTGVNALSPAKLARESGIPCRDLSRWLKEAHRLLSTSQEDGNARLRAAEQRAEIVAGSAGLGGSDLTKYLDRKGVTLGELQRWRFALEDSRLELDGASPQTVELACPLDSKEKALAEAVALSVLKTIRNANRGELAG